MYRIAPIIVLMCLASSPVVGQTVELDLYLSGTSSDSLTVTQTEGATGVSFSLDLYMSSDLDLNGFNAGIDSTAAAEIVGWSAGSPWAYVVTPYQLNEFLEAPDVLGSLPSPDLGAFVMTSIKAASEFPSAVETIDIETVSLDPGEYRFYCADPGGGIAWGSQDATGGGGDFSRLGEFTLIVSAATDGTDTGSGDGGGGPSTGGDTTGDSTDDGSTDGDGDVVVTPDDGDDTSGDDGDDSTDGDDADGDTTDGDGDDADGDTGDGDTGDGDTTGDDSDGDGDSSDGDSTDDSSDDELGPRDVDPETAAFCGSGAVLLMFLQFLVGVLFKLSHRSRMRRGYHQ